MLQTYIYEKYYKHIPSNALCVPTDIAECFAHEWNREKNPDDKKNPNYIVHDKGSVRMDEKVQKFLINQAIGISIANQEYKPKSGFIKRGKEHYVPETRIKNKVHSNQTRPHTCSHVLKFFTASGKTIPGDIGLTNTMSTTIVINNINDIYARTIESYGTYHPIKGGFGYDAQPQLHVGLIATPQLKPTDSNKSYLNSSCYWKVECSMLFCQRVSVSWPLEKTFTANWDRAYTDGQTLYVSGKIESSAIKEESDEENEFLVVKKKKTIEYKIILHKIKILYN